MPSCGGVARCERRPNVDHRTAAEHQCDKRCRPHVCKPLGGSYLRQIHTVLNGAFSRTVCWRWIGTNPVRQADAPQQPAADSNPPSPTQAARIFGEAWRDPGWSMLVWLAMTTGARRGELCALRWDRIDGDQVIQHDDQYTSLWLALIARKREALLELRDQQRIDDIAVSVANAV